MKQPAALKVSFFLAASLLAAPAFATEGTDPELSAVERWKAEPETVFDASEVDLADFKWIARPVVVFADAPADPAFGRQMELLTERIGELVQRDVVLITDTDPSARTDIRRELRPRGFMLTLIGKEGRVVFRKPLPWDVREITRSIDKQPLRKQELKDQLQAE